jgi:hypothetical protein
MDQASKESAQKRMYHRMISHEDGDDGRRARSHKVTALDARGIDRVRVKDNVWYVEDPSLNQPPDGGWDKAFQAKGQPLPRSWNCDNVLDSSKSYVFTRPEDTKTAAAALVYLYERHELPPAGNAWQTQALKPHSIIKRVAPQGSGAAGSSSDSAAHRESMFFVIARGAYAAPFLRIWLKDDRWHDKNRRSGTALPRPSLSACCMGAGRGGKGAGVHIA